MYRERRDHMLKCFREFMPEGVKWTEPSGGLFLFVTLPPSMDAAKLLERALAEECGLRLRLCLLLQQRRS